MGAYKIQILRKLLPTTTDSYILVGDDTEKDPDAYAQISREFPGRIDSIYIHRIRGIALSATSLASGLEEFDTAADLAVKLYSKGLISLASVSETEETILQETRRDRIVPDYQICPEPLAMGLVVDPETEVLLTQVQTKIQSICLQSR